ncbi:hypothetical protein C477_06361 [Haloterrigena salina JCM 13891]|uniref:UPF0146 protein C477_06361 n=1 Tax=Haloterrigena salina JCM 13891 TaxID=1227488 RepID=M0CF72_9EURY|nr:UPF0146 family protein [Haloterrigena salina]ELZ20509.1 hypothetical protein C477_06361 [Haloterrigena salina JCM 13891]
MAHSRRNAETLLETLTEYDRLVEVGIGRRTDVAAALADRGVAVTATDVHDRPVPDGVRFVRDDIVDPDPAVYAAADAIYALNLPPELHRPALAVAREADADLLFTTLGGDQPAIPVERRTIETGTLYVARAAAGRRR